jgi:1-deoxy-D-xylulose-5-phosphate synthase
LKVEVKNFGLPDKFLQHGTREEVLAEIGLDEEGILKAIQDFVA